jgi:hypothetical protein
MSEAIAPPETRTKEAEQLADRYLALWNEPDPERRRRMIAELWTEDGSQILQPPLEMREIAASAGLGMAATLEARDAPSSRRGRQRPTRSGSGPPDSASGGATTSIGCTKWSSSTGRPSRRTAR